MHILQVFLLKQCWENTELMWITLFFSRQCHFSGVKRAKKEQRILGEGVQFCRQFREAADVRRGWAGQTDPGSTTGDPGSSESARATSGLKVILLPNAVSFLLQRIHALPV